MRITADLLESNNQIYEAILNNIKSILDVAINKSINNIRANIRNLIQQRVTNEPEYLSLKNGKLRLEFGIENIDTIDKFIDLVLNTLKVETKPIQVNKLSVSGGFQCSFLDRDELQNLVSSEPALVYDNKGYYLPWAKWLLLEGNKRIVKQYDVSQLNSNKSRSGMGFMIRSDTDWFVPREFAGSITNNWLSRGIGKITEQQITSIIQTEIEKQL
jgi:hypothetical protein